MSKVSVINLETGERTKMEVPPESLARAIEHKHTDWHRYRLDKEDIWLQSWAAYIGSPVAMKYLRNEVGRIIGEVNDDWRHRINTGKAYEIIETAIAYMVQAFFPNRDYFALRPEMPGYRDEARRATVWMKDKLQQANFRTHWEMFLRQCFITGFSCIALPWMTKKEHKKRYEKVSRVLDDMVGEEVDMWDVVEYEKLTYNNAKLEVLDSFDVLVDPNAKNLQDANMFRSLNKTVADVVKGYHNGVYDDLQIAKFLKGVKAKRDNHIDADTYSKKESISSFLGLQYDPQQKVTCYEYWGSIEIDNLHLENVVITVVNGMVARVKDVPYWAGKPFVCAVTVPIPNHAYGLGVLEPVRGMLHENNVLTNARLDSLTLAIQDTWLMVDDGITDPDSVYRAPGHVIEVGDPNSIRPMGTSNDFAISYGEQEFLNARLDASTGIGAYVSASPGRNAERVTAEEVSAVREAGGTRLSSIHRHIERTAFLPFLEKFLYLARQFVVQDEVIEVPGQEPGSSEFYAVGAEELNKEYKMHVIGADFLAEREKVLNDINAYIETVIQVPEWQQMINWELLLEEYTRHFHLQQDFENLIIRGIKQKQAAQDEMASAEGMPMSPEQEVAAMMQQAQGNVGVRSQAGKAAMMGQNTAMAHTTAQMSLADSENVSAATEAALPEDFVGE